MLSNVTDDNSFQVRGECYYTNYKYAPLKGLDTRCVIKATSDVIKKPCAGSASKKDSPCKNKLRRNRTLIP